MANSPQGVQQIGDYSSGTPRANVNKLLALIPNPDSTSSSGAVAGGGFLDEMSPAAAVQLRVELTALAAAVPNA
jgi:hypothetical protein